MALTVNTNVSSLNAQRNLSKSGQGLATSMERLASGMRINSAKDDAAGLQISNRLTSQINGLSVAQRNANDAISIAQTAEGAMQESTNILQRMRELALQAANGSNSSDDKLSLQKEVDTLKTELTRISEKTQFGDIELFNGSFDRDFQVGANAGDTINMKLNGISAADLGGTDGFAMAVTVTETAIGDAEEELTIKVGSTTQVVTLEEGIGLQDAADAINEQASGTGVTAFVDSGELKFAALSTTAVEITGEDGAFSATTQSVTPSGPATGASKINAINVATNADDAINSIDTAIAQIDSQRADLGALQNRFSFTINNLSNIQENVSASRSRIQDTDFAVETANMTKNQILQQAGTSILSQANQIPQAAISLLGG
jgi:flagellin